MTATDAAIARHLDLAARRAVQWQERWRAVPALNRGGALLAFAARAAAHLWRNRRYLTAIKLINMAVVNTQFKLKQQRVWGRPYRMKIESTNICNTKCQLCPTGLGLQGRDKGAMTFEQFAALVDDMKRHLVALDLSMWGDPLIVPTIYRMIRHAHDARIWTYVSSNLHAFKPDRDADPLIDSGLDMLTCSLHGASQATFEAYQPGKSFDTAVAKIVHLVMRRSERGSRTPEIQLNFVVTRRNEHECEAFQALAESLQCKAIFSTASMNTRFVGRDKRLHPLGLAPDLLARRTAEHLQQWLPENPAFVLPVYHEMLKGEYDPSEFNGKKAYPCDWPWRSAVINWDGAVAPCCGSFNPSEDMGNVHDTPFAQIWNGRRYRLARRSFRRRLGAEEAKETPCAQCPGFMP